MTHLIDRPDLRPLFERLESVTLNPERHTAPEARTHSEWVAARAALLARRNRCSPSEEALLVELGLVHDLGKATGTTSPSASVELLERSGGVAPALLELVRYHDVNLAWWLASERGQPPTDRAWNRIARRVDLRLLCLFMVADRVDCPGGWQQNAPLVWFLEQVRKRGLLKKEIVLDVAGEDAERFGIDIGRVIIGGGALPGVADTAFLGGTDESALLTPPMPGAFEAIAALCLRAPARVWLVSKCGPRIQARTRLWLDRWRFFEQTGMPRQHLRFCRQRAEKALVARELALTHFVDDRLDVLGHLRPIVPRLVLFGERQAPPWAHAAPTWDEVPAALGLVSPETRGTREARAR
jgi:HD domain